MMNRRGVTLIEVLMAVVISAIAMFALVPPFIAEGSFFRKGRRQTEAQRDAQVALRALARTARQSGFYQIAGVAGSNTVTFYDKAPAQGGVILGCFQGGLAFGSQFQMDAAACTAASPALIDGSRSRVQSFTATQVIPNKLVRLRLDVAHRLRPTDPTPENEVLETELFLRNGT